MLKRLLRNLVRRPDPAPSGPHPRELLRDAYDEARVRAMLPDKSMRIPMDFRLHNLEQDLRSQTPPNPREARAALAREARHLEERFSEAEERVQIELSIASDYPELFELLTEDLGRLHALKAETQSWFDATRGRLELLLRDSSGFDE
jgi:hypothetical protein